MKGGMHKIWNKASAHTHSVPATYKTKPTTIREEIGPPRPADLVRKVPVTLENGRITHPRVWTVMHTGPKQERVAVAQLRQFGYGAYCPVITKWMRSGSVRRIKHVPLFPRYIFVSVPEKAAKGLNSCAWGKPISTSNNGDIPFFDGREIYAVSDAQAAGVYDEAKIEAERIVEMERLRAARMLVREGDYVVLDDAVWGELGATVVRVSPQDRVLLLMNMLGRATKVTVPLDQIRPAA